MREHEIELSYRRGGKHLLINLLAIARGMPAGGVASDFQRLSIFRDDDASPLT